MSELFQCDDKEGLVAFLYGECRPGERDVIAAHVSRCVACAREVGALSATRKDLSAWVSPASPSVHVDLGSDGAFGPSRRLDRVAQVSTFPSKEDPRPRPVAAAWWTQPLPGWAQLTAAALVFAAGLAAGTARGPGAPPTTVSSGPALASREELGSLAQTLRSEIAQSRVVASPARSSSAEDAVPLRRVEALIAASEERQRRELALRTVQVVRDFDLQRRADLIQMQQAIGQFQGAAGAEVRQHRDAIEDLIRRVSQTGR